MIRCNITSNFGYKETPGGFTLIEVLLVVLLISLIAGVSGGFYIGSYKAMVVEKAARDLLLTAKYARIMAIEQQRQYKLTLDTINNGFYLTTVQVDEVTQQAQMVIVRDPYCKPVAFDEEIRYEDIQITPTGYETVSEMEGQQTIVFSPDGTAQSAIIQFGDGKTHYSLSINAATGKVKISFGTDENIQINLTDLDAK
jgi:prepilin-type N-terminal cleavage/methylation domain-containing protein